MPLNWETNETYNYIDQDNYMMLENRGGDSGRGDAIGRNMDAYFCYNDYRFIEGIQRCWTKINKPIKLFKLIPIRKYYYQGHRYPIRYDSEKGLSRDHTINTVIAYKLAGYSNKELQEFVKHLRWRISDIHKFTLDAWLSIRAISGIKWAGFLFYLIFIPWQWLMKKWNQRIYRKAGFSDEVHQDVFKFTPNNTKSEEHNRYVKMLYPVYAQGNFAMQLFVMRDSWGKRRMQKVMHGMILKYNYWIKMLLDDPNFNPTKELIYSYKAMIGGRWSTSLNEVNDRTLYIVEDEEFVKYNALDVDRLRKLYHLTKT